MERWRESVLLVCRLRGNVEALARQVTDNIGPRMALVSPITERHYKFQLKCSQSPYADTISPADARRKFPWYCANVISA
ncbi:hypothetical protein PV327_002777, partial [Microctonus hyperodae]